MLTHEYCCGVPSPDLEVGLRISSLPSPAISNALALQPGDSPCRVVALGWCGNQRSLSPLCRSGWLGFSTSFLAVVSGVAQGGCGFAHSSAKRRWRHGLNWKSLSSTSLVSSRCSGIQLQLGDRDSIFPETGSFLRSLKAWWQELVGTHVSSSAFAPTKCATAPQTEQGTLF